MTGDLPSQAPGFRGQVGHPEGATLDSCLRLGWSIRGTCTEHGAHTLVPDPARHRRWWTRRLWLLFAEGRLICAVCRQPFHELLLDQGGNATFNGRALAMWSRHDPAIRTAAAKSARAARSHAEPMPAHCIDPTGTSKGAPRV